MESADEYIEMDNASKEEILREVKEMMEKLTKLLIKISKENSRL